MGLEGLRSGMQPEQVALLKRRNYSFHPLSTAGQLDAFSLLSLAWLPVLAFVFVLCLLTSTEFRFGSEGLVSVLYYVGLALILLFPAGSFALLVAGVFSATIGTDTRVRPSAVAYWMWWPFWKLALVLVSVAAATSIGDYLYTTQFLPHSRLERMQAYRDVDPRQVSGKRMNDAGIVQFSSVAGVDRARSGCIKNDARYCVAPIVAGGQLQPNANASQDLFMAGVDCCTCPGEFRCGAWSLPATPGGLRVVDPARVAQFGLAVQEWAATHGRRADRPIFFEWVTDPLTVHDEQYARGVQLKVMSLIAAPIALTLAFVVLNGALQLLQRIGWVRPVEMPKAAPNLAQALSRRFLPQMHKHWADEEENWQPPAMKYVIL